MLLLSLLLFAGVPQSEPVHELRLHSRLATPPVPQHASEPCVDAEEEWHFLVTAMPDAAGDMPPSEDDSGTPSWDDPPSDDGYAPDEPQDEQCPMIFIIPYDFWDGELWFASAHGEQV